jgi:hypothetical protein
MKRSLLNSKLLTCLAPLALCLALAACGGSGAGAYDGTLPTASSSSSSTSSGAPIATVSKVTLFGDSTTLSTARDKPIVISAIVTSPDNVAIEGKNVTFSASDPAVGAGTNLVIDNAVTDKSGLASAKLFLLNDLTERDVKITAKYADATPAEFVVRVAGNVITASGPAQLPLNGEPATYTIQLKDGAGKPIVGQTVSVTSKAGNPVSPATGKTDVGGQATFSVKGSVPGADTVTASALGVNGFREVKVSGESLNVALSSPIVAIGQDAVVTVTYASSAAIPAGTQAVLTTTAGQVRSAGAPVSAGAASASAPISGGTASFNLRANSASPATVSALINGTVSTAKLNFVSVTPSTISVQPSPAILGPNLGTQTTERSQLVAIVRDAAGNPVQGKTVTFNAIEDLSGGRIEPGFATTDFDGTATVSYIAGTSTSPPNGVKIVATLPDFTLSSAPSALSVSKQSLFVNLGTNNLVGILTDQVSFEKQFSIVVTDATGNPAIGATVQAKLSPTSYRTGRWVIGNIGTVAAPINGWVQLVESEDRSEDLDADGQCTAAEDTNSDGALTPGNVASVGNNVVTNAAGIAIVKVTYPQSFSEWAEVALEVTATVGGSEGRKRTQFWLPIPASVVSTVSVPPPGQLSPFPFPNTRPGVKCGR